MGRPTVLKNHTYCECGRRIVVRIRNGMGYPQDRQHILCGECYAAELDMTRHVKTNQRRKIAKAYVSKYGHVTAFDQRGEKMPEFSGRLVNIGPLIRAAGFTGLIEDME